MALDIWLVSLECRRKEKNWSQLAIVRRCFLRVGQIYTLVASLMLTSLALILHVPMLSEDGAGHVLWKVSGTIYFGSRLLMASFSKGRMEFLAVRTD